MVCGPVGAVTPRGDSGHRDTTAQNWNPYMSEGALLASAQVTENCHDYDFACLR